MSFAVINRILFSMNTESDHLTDPHQHPRGPNFLLIVISFCVAIIVVFIAAYLLLSGTGKRLIPGRHNPHPTSSIALPVSNITRT